MDLTWIYEAWMYGWMDLLMPRTRSKPASRKHLRDTCRAGRGIPSWTSPLTPCNLAVNARTCSRNAMISRALAAGTPRLDGGVDGGVHAGWHCRGRGLTLDVVRALVTAPRMGGYEGGGVFGTSNPGVNLESSSLNLLLAPTIWTSMGGAVGL